MQSQSEYDVIEAWFWATGREFEAFRCVCSVEATWSQPEKGSFDFRVSSCSAAEARAGSPFSDPYGWEEAVDTAHIPILKRYAFLTIRGQRA